MKSFMVRNIRKRRWVGTAAILLVMVVGGVVWFRPPGRDYRLADGTVMRVERVSFIKKDPVFLPPRNTVDELERKLEGILPKKWAAKLPRSKFTMTVSWNMIATLHSNADSLHIWITRRDRANGFADVDTGTAALVDDDGCVYPASQSGGEMLGTNGIPARPVDPTSSAVEWFTFEAFPRRQSKMRLRLYNSEWGTRGPYGKPLAEFVIVNPAPIPAVTNWPIEPLPMDKKSGDVTFTLKSVGYKTNWTEELTNRPPGYPSLYPVEMVPTFTAREQGRETAEWEPLEMDLTDSSGNFAPKQWGNHMSVFLSPREPAWKLSVKFFNSEQSAAASNTVWVIHGVKVPGLAEHVPLDGNEDLDGVTVKPVVLAGAGRVVYDHGAFSEISPHKFGSGNSFGFTNMASEVINAETPQIALNLGDLQPDQRMTIRAVAPDNREFYAQPWENGMPYLSGAWTNSNRISYLEKGPFSLRLSYYLFYLPADVKTVDLYFCVHRARTADFIFKPPPQ
jgi:hypothetical protein